MISLKVTLLNSGKQKIAKFSIHAQAENDALDKNAVRGITQLCVATLEMAQNDMVFDLSLLPGELQSFIADILAEQIKLAITQKQLFTANTKPTVLCTVDTKIKLDCNDLLDTNVELYPRAAY